MIKIKKLTKTAVIPKLAHHSDAGYDLASDENVTLVPGERKLISTGLSLEMPELGNLHKDIYGQIKPRSGLAVKYGIDIMAGVIDPGYRGEVKVLLINHGTENFKIKKGDRIAQLIFFSIFKYEIEPAEILSSTERGDTGFGASGR